VAVSQVPSQNATLAAVSADPRWERFAREDPLHYIDPTASRDMTIEQFVASGEPLVAMAFDWAAPVPGRARALEIGCGVGRFTTALAQRFDRVDAVDVSPTMLALATRLGLPANAHLHLGSGRDLATLPDGAFDLAFSHLVFQHIADRSAIASYLSELARTLRPGGVAVLQFDTRPPSVAATALHALPDPLLPRLRRRGARRHRLGPGELHAWVTDAGLELSAERAPGTAEHWLRLVRPEAGRDRSRPDS
jgi:SAM-dependent methyltransferase